jgi:hypothetical protein
LLESDQPTRANPHHDLTGELVFSIHEGPCRNWAVVEVEPRRAVGLDHVDHRRGVRRHGGDTGLLTQDGRVGAEWARDLRDELEQVGAEVMLLLHRCFWLPGVWERPHPLVARTAAFAGRHRWFDLPGRERPLDLDLRGRKAQGSVGGTG